MSWLEAEPFTQKAINATWGDVLTVVSVGLAIYQSLRARSAKKAETQARQQLRDQIAAEHFANLEREAATLLQQIRSESWQRAGELAADVRRAIAGVRGAWKTRLSAEEWTKLDTASSQIDSLISALPAVNTQIAQAGQQQMVAQAYLLLTITGEIAARLKYKDAGEEQGWLAKAVRKLNPSTWTWSRK